MARFLAKRFGLGGANDAQVGIKICPMKKANYIYQLVPYLGNLHNYIDFCIFHSLGYIFPDILDQFPS